jgi:hypothetical protein
MSALTDSATAITAELVTYDAAAAQLAATQAALVQSQTDLATALGSTTLTVSQRASQSALLKATADVLKNDIANQELALTTLRTQLIADSSAFQAQLRGELNGKVSALIQTTIATIQTDYDTSKIMFPVAQIAAAHRDVLALRSIENSLTIYRPGDTQYITFARGAGALLTQIG